MPEPFRQQNRGFTLIELLVVMAIIAILAVLLLPVLEGARKRSKRAVCMGNLKQIGAAYYIFKHDHEDRLPAAVPVAEGGVKEYFFTPAPSIRPGWDTNVFRIFQAMSNILGSPKILVCPADRGRTPVETFPELKPYPNWHHPHVTYSALVSFLGRGEGPKVLYGGDSAPNKDFLKEHLATFAGEGERLAVFWMWGTHTDIGGDMLFGDGRVEVVQSDRYYRYSSEEPILLGTPNVSRIDLGPPRFASEAILSSPQAPSSPPNGGSTPTSSDGAGSKTPSSPGAISRLEEIFNSNNRNNNNNNDKNNNNNSSSSSTPSSAPSSPPTPSSRPNEPLDASVQPPKEPALTPGNERASTPDRATNAIVVAKTNNPPSLLSTNGDLSTQAQIQPAKLPAIVAPSSGSPRSYFWVLLALLALGISFELLRRRRARNKRGPTEP